MQDLENLRSRLAQEEATLARTHEQIDAAQRQIERLHGQIEAVQQQIATTEGGIADLQRHAEEIQKRIALLREYMAMVESAPESPLPLEPAPPAEPAAQPHEPVAPAADSLGELLPSLDEAAPANELGDLSFVDAPTSGAGAASSTTETPGSIDDLDEDYLTTELLPRTQTFEEELILVMAFHRKAIAPKEVARVFRRLDYAPKLAATEKNIKAQVESDHHFFEYTSDGRVALTREGRAEAQRLLEQLR
ncbi:MAG: hypothetical protein AMS25_14040 [Gemmatimonas sp. SM23_52]|nr:MAG: hypothetical protein AMS25_14040 [Gemmatimonas sp. SM23_52]